MSDLTEPVRISSEGLWYVGSDLSGWRLDHPDGLTGYPLSAGATLTVNDRTRAVVRALLVLALERFDALTKESA
jgi:hypothetical protein